MSHTESQLSTSIQARSASEWFFRALDIATACLDRAGTTRLRFGLVLLLLLSPTTLLAQTTDVSAKVSATDQPNEYSVEVTVSLPYGWNTYGTADELTPVEFNLGESESFKTVGVPQIPDGKEKDTASGSRHYLFNEFIIRQRVKVQPGTKSLTASGTVRMTLCKKDLCKPPKSFEFELESKLADIAPAPKATPSSFDLSNLEKDLIEVVQRAKKSTVAIVGEDGGNGTGVIVSPDGLIMTAGHCFVEPGEVLKVILHDGREVDGTGVGLEPGYDCGLMKIDPADVDGEIPFSEMGWSSKLKVNEPLFSIAHGGVMLPGRGAYLRFGRVINPCSESSGFIQNTCLMEPGDSGGPLFNMDGRVVGVRSMIHEELDENFDVPVDLFRRHWNELVQSEKFRWSRSRAEPSFGFRLIRGRSSLRGGGPTSAGAKRGVRISNVEEGSWAAESGLERSDRVLTWNGESMLDPKQLNLKIINAFASGSTADLKVRRGREEQDVQLDFSGLESFKDELNCIHPASDQKIAGTPMSELEDLANYVANLEQELDDYTVRIKAKSKKVVASLVFWLEGKTTEWVVGKSSLIKADEVTVETESGETIKGSVVLRSQKKDLVLVRLEKAIKVPATSVQTVDDTMAIGQFLISPSPKDAGHVSVQSSPEFSTVGGGYLGVEPDQEAAKTAFVIGSPIVGEAAEKAGLKSGDQILKMDDVEVGSLMDGLDFLAKTLPEQEVVLTIKREDEELEINVVLGANYEPEESHQSGHVADQFEGGASGVTKFRKVVLHDARVLAANCGGPVFDMDHNFVGLNIARKSRTRTYILPADEVKSFVAEAIQTKSASE